jgi:ParB-like chromosome segregation protein Spo0J
MQIEIWKVSKLKHNAEQQPDGIDKLAKEIDELGFRVPVIAKTNGEVLFGHDRLAAALRSGVEQIPVIPADDLNADQLRSFSFFFEVISSGPRMIEV